MNNYIIHKQASFGAVITKTRRVSVPEATALLIYGLIQRCVCHPTCEHLGAVRVYHPSDTVAWEQLWGALEGRTGPG